LFGGISLPKLPRGDGTGLFIAVKSKEVSAPVAPTVRSIAAPQIGVHRRLESIHDSKM